MWGGKSASVGTARNLSARERGVNHAHWAIGTVFAWADFARGLPPFRDASVQLRSGEVSLITSAAASSNRLKGERIAQRSGRNSSSEYKTGRSNRPIKFCD